MSARFLWASLLSGTLALASAATGAAQAPLSEWPKPAAFPDEDKAAATEHFRRARAHAVGDLFADFTLRCITDPKYRPRVNAEQYDGYLGPAKVFDNLYYVGQMAVSAWALKTTEGILLFDSLNSETEAREILVPGLVALGLDPREIKWVVVTHSHGDHYGGAPYLQQTFGAKAISSDVDWNVMEAPATRTDWALRPRRDITVVDGQRMNFGATTVTFHITPGHTAGTVSTIFPVTDRGKRHLVGFYGGVGLPRTTETKRAQIASLVRWRKLTQAAGVDAQIGNHPLNDEGLERMEQLLYRGPQDPNPYVLGAQQYQNYLVIQEECVRFSLARDGFRQ
jgi:metallo-beta-lactamase class B